MSRFFRQAGDSDSESEESDEELMSSGDEDAAPSKAMGTKPVMSRFLKTAGSSSSSSDSESDEDSEDSDDGDGDGDSDDDVKKVVKSAKDKRLDEMEATGKVMDNGLKINDWVAISNGTCICTCKSA
jgi:translation initiation factor 3 subunit C